MENFEKIANRSLPELEKEAHILTSEFEFIVRNAVSTRDSVMITFYQNNALHAEIEAYLEYLKINTSEIQSLQLSVEEPVDDELDLEMRELKKLLREVTDGIRQYANKANSSSWNAISGMRETVEALKQKYTESLTEKRDILLLCQQEESDDLAERHQINAILEALRNQHAEKVAVHAGVMSEFNKMTSELSLKARLLKDASQAGETTRHHNSDFFHSQWNK